jgi:hypothetical protein
MQCLLDIRTYAMIVQRSNQQQQPAAAAAAAAANCTGT